MTNAKPSLETFDRNPDPLQAAAALRRDGAVVITAQASTDIVERVAAELRSHFDSEGHYAENDFNGYNTLRVSAILAKSRTAAELIGDQSLLKIVDEILLQFCDAYQIGSTTGIEIFPSESAQELHRDDSIYPMRIQGVEWQLSIMWALNDFTVENGATQVVPGSHRWHSERTATSDEILQMDMPAGSALIYLGTTLHGGGENRSDHPRMGLVNTYSLGWLRQEVNQYLTIPRDVIESYPEHIQRVMGFQVHGEFLGKYPDDPDDTWYND